MQHAATRTILLVWFIPFLFATISHPLAVVQNQESDWLKYEVTDALLGKLKHKITIGNPTDHRITDLDLIVPLIRNKTARHYILATNISSSIGQVTVKSDSSRNEYAQLSQLAIDSKESLTVTIDYLELSFSTQYQISKSSLALHLTDPDLKKFMTPEPFIESDNPEIINEAQNLTTGLSDAAGMASRIYTYVVGHIRYIMQNEERGALWALKNSIGDCSEYSYLFVALCRAVGIPARVNAGFAFYPSGQTVQDGHMWAEYYLENYSWIPVDATWQIFNSIDFRHFDQVHETSEEVSYANYMFSSVDEDKLEEQQTVTLQTANVEDAPFAEEVFDTILQLGKTNLAISLINSIGSLIFPDETAEAKVLLMNSKHLLQDGIETLDFGSLGSSLDQSAEASRIAWAVFVRILAIVLTATIITMSITLVLLKRHYHG